MERPIDTLSKQYGKPLQMAKAQCPQSGKS